MCYGWQTRCAWCGEHMKGAVDAPNISHSICDSCKEDVLQREMPQSPPVEPPNENPYWEANRDDLGFD